MNLGGPPRPRCRVLWSGWGLSAPKTALSGRTGGLLPAQSPPNEYSRHGVDPRHDLQLARRRFVHRSDDLRARQRKGRPTPEVSSRWLGLIRKADTEHSHNRHDAATQARADATRKGTRPVLLPQERFRRSRTRFHRPTIYTSMSRRDAIPPGDGDPTCQETKAHHFSSKPFGHPPRRSKR